MNRHLHLHLKFCV